MCRPCFSFGLRAPFGLFAFPLPFAAFTFSTFSVANALPCAGSSSCGVFRASAGRFFPCERAVFPSRSFSSFTSSKVSAASKMRSRSPVGLRCIIKSRMRSAFCFVSAEMVRGRPQGSTGCDRPPVVTTMPGGVARALRKVLRVASRGRRARWSEDRERTGEERIRLQRARTGPVPGSAVLDGGPPEELHRDGGLGEGHERDEEPLGAVERRLSRLQVPRTDGLGPTHDAKWPARQRVPRARLRWRHLTEDTAALL